MTGPQEGSGFLVMNIKKYKQVIFWAFFLAMVLFGRTGLALEGFTPIGQSEAFKQFLKKPRTNLSKLICILNYFWNAPVMVKYEGTEYTTQFAYPFGLTFLLTHYHDEDPAHWIKKNCYRSPMSNTVIYFKFRDGRYRPARDVFLEELANLEKVLTEQKAEKVQER